MYKAAIESRGDEKQIAELFPDKMIPPAFSWDDHCIIRLPEEVMPEDFMDAKNLARAKANSPKSVYLKEYKACFVEDSEGFFKGL